MDRNDLFLSNRWQHLAKRSLWKREGRATECVFASGWSSGAQMKDLVPFRARSQAEDAGVGVGAGDSRRIEKGDDTE